MTSVHRVALVTGAASGIGAETARQLVDRGWGVGLLDIDGEALARTAAGFGPGSMAIVADVSDPAAMEASLTQTLARFGRLDALVANAAIEILGPVTAMPAADARRVLEVNLLGAWESIRAALPAIIRARGYVLLVTSVAAATQGPFNAAYSAAKAGLVTLGRTLRLEVRAAGVDVGIAYFGYVGTESGRRAVEHPAMAPIMARMPARARTPVPPERAAAALVEAIERRRRRIVVPRSLVLAVELPEVAQRVGERAMRRVPIEWREPDLA